MKLDELAGETSGWTTPRVPREDSSRPFGFQVKVHSLSRRYGIREHAECPFHVLSNQPYHGCGA